jgi:hypothetical protein
MCGESGSAEEFVAGRVRGLRLAHSPASVTGKSRWATGPEQATGLPHS